MSRRTRPRLAPLLLAASLAAVAVATTACGTVPLPCDVTIAAVPLDTRRAEGDALPESVTVVVAPAQIDRSATAIETDQSGQIQVIIKATGDGAARLADYTGTHVGEALAIAINGTVVAVPVVNDAIMNGDLAISPATATQGEFVKQFAGCVRDGG